MGTICRLPTSEDRFPLVREGLLRLLVVLGVREPEAHLRLEVLHGPASVLYGQASPGGLVDMVSKRPTATPQNEVDAVFGSFKRFQGAFDIGGPIDTSSTSRHILRRSKIIYSGWSIIFLMP